MWWEMVSSSICSERKRIYTLGVADIKTFDWLSFRAGLCSTILRCTYSLPYLETGGQDLYVLYRVICLGHIIRLLDGNETLRVFVTPVAVWLRFGEFFGALSSIHRLAA